MGSVSLIGLPERVDLAARRASEAGVGVGAGSVFATSPAAAAEAFGHRLPWCASRSVLHARLQDEGFPVAPWAQAATLHEAHAALEDLGLPVVVRACRPGAAAAMRVDHAPDLELAVVKTSRSGGALIQRFAEGVRVTVDAVVAGDAVRIAAITEKRPGAPPFLFPISLAVPAALPGDAGGGVEQTVARLAVALDAPPGPFSVELAVSGESLTVLGAALCPGAAAFYGELIDLACGGNYLGACVRAAAGMPVEDFAPARQGAAVAWIAAHSGIVAGVAGLEKAKGMAGVVEAAVDPPRGMPLRHAVDEASRDLTGWIVATGIDGAEARERALAAADAVEIVRAPLG